MRTARARRATIHAKPTLLQTPPTSLTRLPSFFLCLHPIGQPFRPFAKPRGKLGPLLIDQIKSRLGQTVHAFAHRCLELCEGRIVTRLAKVPMDLLRYDAILQ